MFAVFCFVLAILASPFKSKSRLEAENAALRHQLIVLRRKAPGRVRLTNNDRWFLVQLYRWFPSILTERLIGTLRRECLDQMVILGEAHLRQILTAYAAYYNQTRTHLALQKDAPLHRAVQRSGAIVAIPILAGLHHKYVRI